MAFRAKMALFFGLLMISFQVPQAHGFEGLVEPHWLQNPDHGGSVQILQVDPKGAFVPGAIATDFENDPWRVDYPGLPGMLPNAPTLQMLINRLGLRPSSPVVIVSTGSTLNDVAVATRIAWTLRVAGFPNVMMLNGGLAAWVGAGGAVEASPKKPDASADTIVYQGKYIADSSQVFSGEEYGTPPLDLRTAAYYQGERGHPLVDLNRGTLHGAANIPAELFIDEGTGRFRSLGALRQLLKDFIGTNRGPVVVFSDTGLRAAIGWFALETILKQPDVRLYDGGFLDWQGLDMDIWDQTDDMGGVIG